MTLQTRKPGERGYAAYWRQEFGDAATEIRVLKQQMNGTLSGRAIIGVMNVYGAHINNTSGRSQLAQTTLASRSGYGRETVKRAQQWAVTYGWLAEISVAVPGKVGKTIELRVGTVPTSTERHVGAAAETCGSVDPTCSSVEPTSSSAGEPQTLIPNSHRDSQSPRHPDVDKAPCFCLGVESCDRCAMEVRVEMCDFHGSYPKDACYYCDQSPAESRLSSEKQEEHHVRHLAHDEKANPWGEPLESARPRGGFALGSRSRD